MRTVLLFLLSCFTCWAQPDMDFLLSIPPSSTAVAPWTPANAAGLKFWFRSESLGALATEGASVSNWPNSVTGNELWYATNETSTTWPTLTNTFNGLAGTNALVFNGTSACLWVSNATARAVTKNVASCSIIGVAREDNNTNLKYILAITRNSAGSSRESLYFGTDEKANASQRTLDADTLVVGTLGHASSLTSATCVQVDHIHTNAVAVTGSAITIYTNGVLGTNVVGATPAYTSDTTSTQITIGQLNGASFFLGEIAEILVYVPAITAAERGSNYAYLKAKFNLP